VGKTIPDFVKEVIYAREDFVTKNPETTKAFLRAYVKAMKFVKENKAEAVAINAKTLNFSVKDSELGYDEMSPAWPANSMPSLVGFNPLVSMMFEAKQIKKKYTPEELSNLKALKEVLTELKIKY
jgi:ABC-type nitrate/sulfonate/bicarbonate transport system substrate-binding protein